MNVVIIQPAYLPWVGFFQRCALADRVILLDHVEADRSSRTGFVNRNRIKTAQGVRWLTVPLLTRAGEERERRIDRLRIDPSPTWRKKSVRTVEESYRKAPHFAALEPLLHDLVAKDTELLVDLLESALPNWFAAFGIEAEVTTSRDLEPTESKSALILELCRAVGARTYISGPFGESYLDLQAFADAKIEVQIHEYQPLPYPQLHGAFEPGLSALDFLMNLGPEAKDRLRAGEALRAPRAQPAPSESFGAS